MTEASCDTVMIESDHDDSASDSNMDVDENNCKDGEGIHLEEKSFEGKIQEPKLHMLFDSAQEAYDYYRKYAKSIGFGINKRNCKKVNGELKYITFACHKSGKPSKTSVKIFNQYPVIKCGCNARLIVNLLPTGKWGITTLELQHNHEVSPTKAQFFRCHRNMPMKARRKIVLDQKSGIPMNKTVNSLRVQYGNKEMPFTKKDCENFAGELRRLKLAEGDANALQKYFIEMQARDSNFFYVVDVDDDNRIENLFWADARSRAAYDEFGDAVTFDTTYLTNKYDMPFAPFVGVNHHGQSILFGCGLISNEDTSTFVWLFDSWLSCMSKKAPKAIITDQDRAMQNAIEIIFPKTRHRWCLWHIMKKIPEKFKGYKEYESIRDCLYDVVYDSLKIDEFEYEWRNMITVYNLGENEWLDGWYKERNRWAPCFVKNHFWAGMSSTQRSESMNAFFDGYVNAKTSLREFVEQYENALRSKVEKELEADSQSLTSTIRCFTPHAMEKQFQDAYTNAKFKDVQNEFMNIMLCECSTVKSSGGTSYYEVKELKYVGLNQKVPKNVEFQVCFFEGYGERNFDIKCECQMFEFCGILCRHVMKVLLFQRHIYMIPSKYILSRWRKDVKRSHTKSKVIYNDWFDTEEGREYDKLCSMFHEVADVAYNDVERRTELVALLDELKVKWNLCGVSMGASVSNVTTRVLSPIKKRGKGRPPVKRKQSKVEQVINKYREAAKKNGIETSKSKQKKRPKKVKDVDTQPLASFDTNRCNNIDLNESLYGEEDLDLGST